MKWDIHVIKSAANKAFHVFIEGKETVKVWFWFWEEQCLLLLIVACGQFVICVSSCSSFRPILQCARMSVPCLGRSRADWPANCGAAIGMGWMMGSCWNTGSCMRSAAVSGKASAASGYSSDGTGTWFCVCVLEWARTEQMFELNLERMLPLWLCCPRAKSHGCCSRPVLWLEGNKGRWSSPSSPYWAVENPGFSPLCSPWLCAEPCGAQQAIGLLPCSAPRAATSADAADGSCHSATLKVLLRFQINCFMPFAGFLWRATSI